MYGIQYAEGALPSREEVAFKLDDLLFMVSQAPVLPHHVVSQASEEDKKSVKRKD